MHAQDFANMSVAQLILNIKDNKKKDSLISAEMQ